MCLQHIRLWFGSSGEAHVRRACVSSTYSVRDWHCMASGFAVGEGAASDPWCDASCVRSVKVTQSGVFYTFFAASLGLSTVLARSALDYPDRCLARSYTAYTDRCTRTEKAAERRRGRPSLSVSHQTSRQRPNKPNKRRASRMGKPMVKRSTSIARRDSKTTLPRRCPGLSLTGHRRPEIPHHTPHTPLRSLLYTARLHSVPDHEP